MLTAVKKECLSIKLNHPLTCDVLMWWCVRLGSVTHNRSVRFVFDFSFRISFSFQKIFSSMFSLDQLHHRMSNSFFSLSLPSLVHLLPSHHFLLFTELIYVLLCFANSYVLRRNLFFWMPQLILSLVFVVIFIRKHKNFPSNVRG